ncbi:MAG: terpene cyclase/mutase family protein [Clostridia bacterium]|nr:terpene cyclase/mutase family protein [Clostridia bacterium]
MKKIVTVLISIILIFQSAAAFSQSAAGAYLKENLFSSVSSSECDWSAIALSLCGEDFDKEAYLSRLSEYVTAKYAEDGSLGRNKSTEWHRIALTVAALGGNAESFGGINLINDGVFYREGLGRQGLNAYIWALICAKAQNFAEPNDAINTYDSIIAEILSAQNEDGGFSLSGNVSDADVTAMAVYALSEFSDRAEVGEAIEKAVSALSLMQTETGDFESNGTANAESTAQVIIALSALGIDANSDDRFVKNGIGVCDALSEYKIDGAYCHVKGGSADKMATYQSLIAECAYKKRAAIYKFEAAAVKEENVEIVISEEVTEAEITSTETETEIEIEIASEEETESETEAESEANGGEDAQSSNDFAVLIVTIFVVLCVLAAAIVLIRRRYAQK